MDNTEKRSSSPKRSFRITVFVLVGILATLTVFAGGFFVGYCSDSSEVKRAREVIRYIDGLAIYAETDKDKDEIARAVVKSYLADDKYAVYYSKEEYERAKRESSGDFVGFGLNFYVRQGTGNTLPLNGLAGVYKNSSAYFAGLKKGDVLTKGKTENDSEFTEFTEGEATTSFFSDRKEGDVITVLVTREGEFTDREFTLTKGKFTASYVTYSDSEKEYRFVSSNGAKLEGKEFDVPSELPSDTAYIKFELFEGDAVWEMQSALGYMESRGRTKLVLDLRDNGGGYLDVLTEIASNFIYNGGNGKNAVSVTIDKKGKEQVYYASDRKFCNFITDLSVIANGNTASASECLLGALLYYKDMNFSIDRLVLTYNEARKDYSTYGKGIVQSTFFLSFGGAIKFTTGLVYQPDGKTCIHEVGIKQPQTANCVTDANAVKRAVEILNG